MGILHAAGDGPARLGRLGQLEEMLRRILAAAGRMHTSDLTRICADRFPSLLESGDVLLATIRADWVIVEDTTPALDSEEATEAKLSDESLARCVLRRLTATGWSTTPSQTRSLNTSLAGFPAVATAVLHGSAR